MKLYRSLLKETWQICRKYKFLWIFGFFSILLSSGGEINLFLKVLQPGLKRHFLFNIFNLLIKLISFQSLLESLKTPSFIYLLSFIILLFLSLTFVSLVSRASIVNAVSKEKRKEKPKFSSTLQQGIKNFWPVLGLYILALIIIILSFSISSLPFYLSYSSGNNLENSWGLKLFLILFFFLFIPLLFIISFVTHFALCDIVIYKNNILKSFKNGIKLFFNNWLISLESAFLIFLIELIIGTIFLLTTWGIASLLGFVKNIFILTNFSLGIISIPLLFFITSTIIFILLTAIFGLFQNTYWTLLFLKLNKQKKFLSKIERIFYSLLAK